MGEAAHACTVLATFPPPVSLLAFVRQNTKALVARSIRVSVKGDALVPTVSAMPPLRTIFARVQRGTMVLTVTKKSRRSLELKPIYIIVIIESIIQQLDFTS